MPCLGTTGRELEADSRQMMALVDDEVTIGPDQIRHLALADKTLDERDVDDPGRLAMAAADYADMRWVHGQKCPEAGNPLVKQLATMDEHQSIALSPSNQRRRNHGLPERRGRCEHAKIVRDQRFEGLLLHAAQLAHEPDAGWQGASGVTMVLKVDANVVRSQQ